MTLEELLEAEDLADAVFRLKDVKEIVRRTKEYTARSCINIVLQCQIENNPHIAIAETIREEFIDD